MDYVRIVSKLGKNKKYFKLFFKNDVNIDYTLVHGFKFMFENVYLSG